jgi:hypothetical protein
MLERRRGRGRTINYKGKERTSQSKGEVVFSSRLGRAVGGDDLTEFVTEMGVVVRTNAPLNVQKWAHIDENTRLKMFDILLVSMNSIHFYSEIYIFLSCLIYSLKLILSF